ncbi:MAG: alpha/beta hydrolase [Bdellovibrionaceae bacterium]|nr:alpha/beta hydrolase [Pseudobdellovibrionaceae bacterium]
MHSIFSFFCSCFFSLFFSLSAAAQIQAADFNTTCAKFSAPLTGGYCVHVPSSHRSRDIVYHLHGSGGSEADFQDPWYYTGQIRAEWKKTGQRLPTVVSISFGSFWLLAEKNASPYSGMFELLTQQVIPSIEAGLGGLRGKRIVFGESMGGFNTAQLALKTKLFSRAAILCAPMSEVSPYADLGTIKAHLEKSAAHQYWRKRDPDAVFNTMKEVITLVQTFFPTEQDYVSANPLVLASNSRSRTHLYVTAGFHDVYALYEGNEKFSGILRASHRRVEWRPQWGGHCVMDIPSLARFLVD